MKVLEQDSLDYEAQFLGLSNSARSNMSPLEEYSWVDENYMEDIHCEDDSDLYHRRRCQKPLNTAEDYADGASAIINIGNCEDAGNRVVTSSCSSSPTSHLAQGACLNIEDSGITTTSNESHKQKIISPGFSNDEILFNYWKIQNDLRVSSVALQRWMISVISLVAIWLTLNLVMWLSYDPNLIDLVNFFLPLLLLPLLSSAYAEVNQEGQRVLKFICLKESRLDLFLVLQIFPLEMTVYNYSLSYKTIGTVAFGVLLALASKILLQKVFQ